MKLLKKVSTLVLSLVIVFNVCAVVSAGESAAPEPEVCASSSGIMPLWTDVATITTGLKISNDTASMKVNVRAYNNIKRVEVTARLQKYSGGWQTIGTYYPSNNNYYLIWSQSQTANVVKGYNYRLYATVKVYELSGSTYVLKETIDRTYEYRY